VDKAADIERRTGQKLTIGEPIIFMASGDAGFKIREAPLVGIFSYRNPTTYMNEVALVDAQTVRVLSEIQVATADVDVDDRSLSLLGQGASLDDMFGGGSAVEGGGSASLSDAGVFDDPDTDADTSASASAFGGASLMEELSGMLAGNSEQRARSADAAGGDWNFIVVRLASKARAERFIAKTRDALEGFGAMAVGWRFAAGSSAIIALLVQALFNAGVLLVSVACVLAVMNILLIAVFRRTKEIGTLRAIGARDNYIRALILSENCALGIFAGALGVVMGSILLEAVNGAQISLSNDLLASILGGSVLHIAFSPALAAVSLAVAFVLSFLSSIYPVETAVKIAPIVAVQNG
jgi:ABC-type antimicrobial peptide transport system permease subunit